MSGPADNMSKQKQDEFHKASWLDRLPLVIIKVISFALMILAAILTTVSDGLEDRLSYMATTFTLVAIYINLAYLKNSVKEFFREPVRFHGYPILFCAIIFSIWHQYIRW
jgi:hypothetical protein